ncbi:MAG: hypothetical protein ACRD18_15580 [Terriglobia bacterium]
MPLIQLPPAPPEKETVAYRLEVQVLDELKRYGAFLGTRNWSHIVSQCLQKVFRTDPDYKTWLKTHPNFVIDRKPRRNGATPQQHGAALSGASAPQPTVDAAQAAS